MLHRPDPDTDDPEPACPVCYDDDAEYTRVQVAAYRPHYDLCGYPQCFGGEHRSLLTRPPCAHIYCRSQVHGEANLNVRTGI